MMSSMDAEAEMEGLFGGEEQEQDATQTLTQEEREAGGADLDVTGAGDGVVKPKKTVIRKPQPKLDNDRLMGPRGINTLEDVFTDFKPRGKGREFEDLDVVMKRMEHWAHRLYPKLPFDSVLEVIANRLGKRKVVQTHVKKIRLGMVVAPGPEELARREAEEEVVEEEVEREVQRYGEEQQQQATDDLFNSMLNQVGQTVAAPVSRAAGLTEEQKERMRRSREEAAVRRREKEQREALERQREEEEDDMDEIEREMTSGSATEWGGEVAKDRERAAVEVAKDRERAAVEAAALDTVEQLHRDKKAGEAEERVEEVVAETTEHESEASKSDNISTPVVEAPELEGGVGKDVEVGAPEPVIVGNAVEAVGADAAREDSGEATAEEMSLDQMMEEMEED